jgi:hypothetical protein
LDNLIGISKDETGADLTEVETVLMKYFDRIIKEAKDNLENDGSNASRRLTQSIVPYFEIETTRFGLKYICQVKMEDYWQFVDQGTWGESKGQGRRPPVGPLMNWIRNKETFQLRGRDRIGQVIERGPHKGKKITLNDVIYSNALGIARKIGTRGTQGTRFLSRVITEEFYREFNTELSKALGRDVAVNIVANLKDKEGNIQSYKL